VLGVYDTLYLVAKGAQTAEFGARTEASYLAGIFRSIRFGVDEAHGKSNIVQLNYLREAGAFTFDAATGRFGLAHERFAPAIRALARDLLLIEAEGDEAAARKFLERYGNMPGEVADALARLKGRAGRHPPEVHLGRRYVAMPILRIPLRGLRDRFRGAGAIRDESLPCPKCGGEHVHRLVSKVAFSSGGKMTTTSSSSSCSSCSSGHCSSCGCH